MFNPKLQKPTISVISGLFFLTISIECLGGSPQWQIIVLVIAVFCFLSAAFFLIKTISQEK